MRSSASLLFPYFSLIFPPTQALCIVLKRVILGKFKCSDGMVKRIRNTFIREEVAKQIMTAWGCSGFFGKAFLRVRYPFKCSKTARLLTKKNTELNKELEDAKMTVKRLTMKNYVLGFGGEARKAMDDVYSLATRDTANKKTIDAPLDVNGVDVAVQRAVNRFLGQTEMKEKKVTYRNIYKKLNWDSIKSGMKITIPRLEEIVLAALYASKNCNVILMPNDASDGLSLKVGMIQSNDAFLLVKTAVQNMNPRAKVEIEKSYPFALRIELPRDSDIILPK
jgi:hypothetical protein